ncbi:hypothetical protein HanPI659440_Chr05g0192111 [Helianthus annuus]|nr:hypothetical protein HanPI659440_Chr05g0192111 [Helianthus annuus]
MTFITRYAISDIFYHLNKIVLHLRLLDDLEESCGAAEVGGILSGEAGNETKEKNTLMVVMDEKGNEKNGTMHEEQSNPTKISITEGSTRAVPNQHGPVLSPCRKITQFR